jgi:hypothetical protein
VTEALDDLLPPTTRTIARPRPGPCYDPTHPPTRTVGIDDGFSAAPIERGASRFGTVRP